MNEKETDRKKEEDHRQKREMEDTIRASYIARDLGYDGKEVTGTIVDWLYRIKVCVDDVVKDRKELKTLRRANSIMWWIIVIFVLGGLSLVWWQM